jgi:ATP-dependent protease ClpP protease subunit
MSEATQVEQDNAAAEAEKFRAEAAKARKEVEIGKLQLEMQQMSLQEHRYGHAFHMAGDFQNRVYRFRGGVNEDSVTACVDTLVRWSRVNPDGEMTVVLNSPGGYVHSGMELFDTILELRQAGHHMTGVGRGMVASMGSILLQAFDWRVMGPGCSMLVHEPSGMAYGSAGALEDAKAHMDMTMARILDIYAERCAASAAPKPLTRAQLKAGWNRKDWWLASARCLEGGLIDEIR